MAELYSLDGDRVVPTQYTAGPWSDKLQHAGPPAAMLGRALTPKQDDGLAGGGAAVRRRQRAR